ncbi:MAG: mechanosensitive ion channel [Acidimicrobiales bacterium]|nr:mechanosensitive ion channel [Hyphomonadaceae bacterium]RZV44323.1 MAG: mechanosensitive ion channel [Acidimicrobiales bacterium]
MDILVSKLNQIPDLLITFAPKLLLALAIFFIGRIILKRAMKVVHKTALKIPNIDATLAGFFTSTIQFVGLALIIVAALTALDIQLGFLASIFAALVLALGFALQGALGDLASGILLILFRPYNIGDDVELNGTKGVVESLGMFNTRMTTRDKVEIIVANGDAIGNTIKNFTVFGDRRLDMDFGVSYDADLNMAIEAILKATDGDDRIYKDPSPWAKVVGLGESAVIIQLRVWCDTDDHRKIKMDMSYNVKKALDAAGVEIPYPHAVILQKDT